MDFSDYIVFVDESGDHSLQKAKSPDELTEAIAPTGHPQSTYDSIVAIFGDGGNHFGEMRELNKNVLRSMDGP